MKRVLLFTLLVTFFATTFSQTLLERRVDYFVDHAHTFFDLSDNQKEEIKEARVAYFAGYKYVNTERRNGFINSEVAKQKAQLVNNEFRKRMKQITKKEGVELEPFYASVKIGLKDIY